jgi:hypothetical protein
MKVISRNLWIILAVVLLVALFAAIQVTAAPAAQTATPTPKPAPVVDTANPTVPFLKDWQGSGHADAKSEAFRHWDTTDPQAVPTTCAKCHSSGGHQDFLGADGSAAGKVDKPAPVNTVIDCVACHNTATLHETSVVFPSGIELKNLGAESRCMDCHQGRESKLSVDKQITDTFKLTPADEDTVVKPIIGKDAAGKPVTTTFGFRDVHYLAAGVTQNGTLVKGGYEYDGQSYDGKFQHPAPYDNCIACHNQHTSKLDVAKCATCHTGVKTTEDLAKIRMNGSLEDFNGNGDTKEGIQAEVAGLQAKLLTAIQAYAKEVAKKDIAYDAATYPYWFTDTNSNGKADPDEAKFPNAYASWTPRLLKAAYNYQLVSKEPGAFAHNSKYVIQLMHDSIADLNTKLSKPVDITKAARNDAGHFNGTGQPFRHWDAAGAVPASCAKCHSSTGLPEYIKNGGTEVVDSKGNVAISGVTEAEPTNGFACTTCHNDLTKFTLYPVTSVPLASGKSVTFSTEKDDKGNLKPVAANLCVECHQGRNSTATVNAKIGNAEDDKVPANKLNYASLDPHYLAAGASLFGNDSQIAYQYTGKDYSGRNMHAPGFQDCTQCHNTHEQALNFDKCVTCHTGAKTPQDIRMTKDDLDGDKNVTEGVAGELQTMEEKLYAAIQAYAKDVAKAAIVYDTASYPYWFTDKNGNGKADPDETQFANAYTSWTPRLLRAAYNYQYAQKDPGLFAHNSKYAAQFLYDSLEDLGKGGVKVDLTGMVRPAVAK